MKMIDRLGHREKQSFFLIDHLISKVKKKEPQYISWKKNMDEKFKLMYPNHNKYE